MLTVLVIEKEQKNGTEVWLPGKEKKRSAPETVTVFRKIASADLDKIWSEIHTLKSKLNRLQSDRSYQKKLDEK